MRVGLERPYNIAITGVGGTGVLTIGAILGMAAHLEGKASMILDMAGLAQKGGAVLSHVRLARDPDEVTTPRIVTGGADLLIAADSVVAASKDGVTLCAPERTVGIVNTHLTPVADFARNRDFDFRERQVMAAVRAVLREGADFEPFSEVALAVTGDAIATNLMMLGFAFQRGLIPLAADSILRAIELNGVAIEANRAAFGWGRKLAAAPAEVHALTDAPEPAAPETLEQIVAHRSAFLEGYQGKRLARRYRALVERVAGAGGAIDPDGALALAVARYYFKLLAYKDEYEVARLYTDGEFERRLAEQFEGDFKLALHLAPPALARLDPNTGRPRKRRFGRWMLERLPSARAAALPARHGARSVRLQRGAPRGAPADRGLRGADRGDPGRPRSGAARGVRSRSPRCRTRSEGSARSRRRRSRPRAARQAELLELFRRGPAPASRPEAA